MWALTVSIAEYVILMLQTLTVYNESRLRQLLHVQLCDEGGNPTPEGNIKVQLARDQGIKVRLFTVFTHLYL